MYETKTKNWTKKIYLDTCIYFITVYSAWTTFSVSHKREIEQLFLQSRWWIWRMENPISELSDFSVSSRGFFVSSCHVVHSLSYNTALPEKHRSTNSCVEKLIPHISSWAVRLVPPTFKTLPKNNRLWSSSHIICPDVLTSPRYHFCLPSRIIIITQSQTNPFGLRWISANSIICWKASQKQHHLGNAHSMLFQYNRLSLWLTSSCSILGSNHYKF